MPGPLQGIRVLDIATIVAAPLAATLMADYGADVVKVELPGKGDGLRTFPPFKDGKPLWWKVANRNKDCVSLDLRKPEGADLLLQMLPRFDVLIENFRTGTLAKWGLSRERLWQANPKLVILRATAFGQTGPFAEKPGFARMFEAMSGLTYMTGESDRMPMHNGYPVGDAIGGLFGAISVLTALLGIARGTVKAGEEIDLSLTEATYRILDFQTIQYDQLGTVTERAGNGSHYSAPANVFQTRDKQYVSLSGSTQATFKGNAHAIGRPDLLQDPRFQTNQDRYEHRDELNEIFGAWFANTDLIEVLHAFEREKGTLAPILSAAQFFEHAQFIARDAIQTVPDDDFGQVRMQAVVPKFTNNPGQIKKTAGELGRDNKLVFARELGLTDEQIDGLKSAGVL